MIADPSQHPGWDGNDNLAKAAHGQQVRSVGDVFSMTLTRGSIRENHVVEFVEGQVIAWKPAELGRAPVGHLWRWEVEPIDDDRSVVVHTYDWTELRDESRYERAQATTSEHLAASINRLAALAETQTHETKVTTSQQELLGERLADLEAGPDTGRTWDDIERDLRGRR